MDAYTLNRRIAEKYNAYECTKCLHFIILDDFCVKIMKEKLLLLVSLLCIFDCCSIRYTLYLY